MENDILRARLTEIIRDAVNAPIPTGDSMAEHVAKSIVYSQFFQNAVHTARMRGYDDASKVARAAIRGEPQPNLSE